MPEDFKYMLMYVGDPSIARGGDPANQRTKTFKSQAAMLWFITTNKEARDSLLANRIQFIEVVTKNVSQAFRPLICRGMVGGPSRWATEKGRDSWH